MKIISHFLSENVLFSHIAAFLVKLMCFGFETIEERKRLMEV